MELDGFFNILKPPGMTSHDVVGYLRRILHQKRIGHTGTLDPGAAGVLPVAVGKATRLIEYLDAVPKSYRAELLFGRATDSGDLEGNTIAEILDFSMPSAVELQGLFQRLIGKIEQRPPIYSAIKIGGKRACDLARSNSMEEIEIPLREVEIHALRLIAYRAEEKKILFDIDCSKGTYIRSLCMDIGEALGIPATMSFLVRTGVGSFQLASSYTLEEIAALSEEEHRSVILSGEEAVGFLPRFDLPEKRAAAFCNGLSTRIRGEDSEAKFRVFSGGRFLGIARYDALSSELVPEKVFRIGGLQD